MNRAAVSIPEKLFFKIGEVCDITGIQAHVLRYWESEFPMLAPQKNRAGQRTYRKRDVEMVLRIKELLYEDQYTIAGAKKRLTNELRGASKLKVVTPEMSAQVVAAATPAPQLVPAPPPEAEESPRPFAETRPDPPPAAPAPRAYAAESEAPVTEESRAALRRLREQLRDIMLLLEAEEPRAGSTRR
ncbi:MAG TPA: MerR family transcriptional regulator [Pyrinomonadaceae bacterium]|jgi:DNA-binding transcriptional MerR regulator